MQDSGWQVYIVECADLSLYTGIAMNVKTRVAQHNNGAGAKYTRSRRPVTLVFCEQADNRGAALRREHEIKQFPAAEKRLLIAKGAS